MPHSQTSSPTHNLLLDDRIYELDSADRMKLLLIMIIKSRLSIVKLYNHLRYTPFDPIVFRCLSYSEDIENYMNSVHAIDSLLPKSLALGLPSETIVLYREIQEDFLEKTLRLRKPISAYECCVLLHAVLLHIQKCISGFIPVSFGAFFLLRLIYESAVMKKGIRVGSYRDVLNSALDEVHDD